MNAWALAQGGSGLMAHHQDLGVLPRRLLPGQAQYRHGITETETTVRRFHEALSTGDMMLVDEALAADGDAIPTLRTGPGADGWQASIARLRGLFNDLTVMIEDTALTRSPLRPGQRL